MSGFKITDRFKDASAIINRFPTDDNKFNIFVTKLLQRLTTKDHKQPLFSPEELEQLISTFSITAEELNVSMNCLCFVFEQSAYTTTGAEKLFDVLQDAGFSQMHSKAIGRLWASDGPEYIQKLKTQTLGYPSLQSSDFRFHMITATNETARLNDPVAIIDLNIGESDRPDSDLKEKIQLEFNHPELFSFFDQIERIQKQLDSLN